MKLALFDFDGTITKRDSFIDFIFFAIGLRELIMGFIILSPFIVLYKLHIISNSKAKEIVFKYFFAGWNAAEFEKIASRYSIERLPHLIKDSAFDRLMWHREQHHTVTIVTASMEPWLKDWCKTYGIDLIATRPEHKDGKVTGRFLTKNCYGPEKVRRIMGKYELRLFEYIYAYGDSRGDKEMLQLADESHYKNFK